jgi:hypothetical protein
MSYELRAAGKGERDEVQRFPVQGLEVMVTFRPYINDGSFYFTKISQAFVLRLLVC